MALNARTDTPPPVDVRTMETPPEADARPMPAVTAAGVDLAKLVLKLVCGAIFALLIYLFLMDLMIGNDLRGFYAKSESRASIESAIASDIARLQTDFAAASGDVATWSDDAGANARAVVALLEGANVATATQRAALLLCAAPATLPEQTRAQTLTSCAADIGRIRNRDLARVQRAGELQASGEAAQRLNEHRSAQHAFWLQAAQLVLLNLLLPLLTALLGYIFGAQQAGTIVTTTTPARPSGAGAAAGAGAGAGAGSGGAAP